MSKNSKVDILFIPSPIKFKQGDNFIPKGDDTSTPPIGIMYIATFLNSQGYNCKILEVGLKGFSLQETIAYIKKISPRVVGISILTPSTITAVPLAREIKKKIPHIIIGCGGMHVSVDPTFIKRYPYFDFGVKGEGESIMLEIMKKLDVESKISGLYNGGYVKNLDTLPFPDYRLISFKEYGYPLDKIGERRAPIAMITSRGCPFSCSFCCKNESRNYVRFRSAKNIVDEIEKNYPISRGEYSFMDDTFTLNKRNAIEICKDIIKRKLKISWVAMTRADYIDIKLARLLKKSGCRELFLGVESGDFRIRNKVIKKKVSDEDIFKTIKICRFAGIRSSIFLMLGFPSENKKEVEKTINYPISSKADIMGIHLTLPLPGSELYKQSIKEKIIPKDIIDKYILGKLGKDFSSWPSYVPVGLSLNYLKKARAKALRKFYLSPYFLIHLLLYYIRFPFRIKYDKHLYRKAFSFLFRGKSIVQFS